MNQVQKVRQRDREREKEGERQRERERKTHVRIIWNYLVKSDQIGLLKLGYENLTYDSIFD